MEREVPSRLAWLSTSMGQNTALEVVKATTQGLTPPAQCGHPRRRLLHSAAAEHGSVNYPFFFGFPAGLVFVLLSL